MINNMEHVPNILVVDDNPDNLKVVGEFLKEEGYNIALAVNKTSAFEILNHYSIDLILLDIMMPDANGYEVCREIKANDKLKEIPVIFISALTDISDKIKAFKTGGVDYISKPFQAEEVKARVYTHIELRQQKKQLQEQSCELQKLNSDKDRFISILAHDLKSPFTVLLGYTDLLSKNIRTYDISEIGKRVEYINNAGKGIFNLLEEILLWVRAQSGKLPFEPCSMLFSNFAEDIIESLKLQADAKGILIKQFSALETFLYADMNMLATVLRNLVSNAIKFTNRGGQIKIFAEQNITETIITVSDNGVGMSQEVKDKLFDIAQLYTSAGTADEKGTGLGLLLCKEFIEKHGGRIWVESEKGVGSEFKFAIPKK
jgi:two-component system sensor histidine kinase/response regulator